MYYYGSEARFSPEEITAETNGKKSLASLFILLMLRNKSSEQHPFSPDEILDRLEREEGIQMEKQAVVRAVKLLADSDVHVFYKARAGAWFDKHRLCA